MKTRLCLWISPEIAETLQDIAKAGHFKDLKSLVESILFEIALDQGLEKFDKSKSNGHTLQSSSVASP